MYLFSRDIGKDSETLKKSLAKTASQLSAAGRRISSVDDLINLHVKLADGTFAGKSVYSVIDITLETEDTGEIIIGFR